jgi:hypothetical protein
VIALVDHFADGALKFAERDFNFIVGNLVAELLGKH